MAFKPELGRVAVSKAGRDAGRYFVIVKVVDTQYVLIADGNVRRLVSPKKKKLKHLELKSDVLESIGQKLKEGRKVFDAEVRAALAALRSSDREDKGESELV